MRAIPGSPGRLSEFCYFSEKAKKDLCDKTKCQEDKVISKQLSENKAEGVKWGR